MNCNFKLWWEEKEEKHKIISTVVNVFELSAVRILSDIGFLGCFFDFFEVFCAVFDHFFLFCGKMIKKVTFGMKKSLF